MIPLSLFIDIGYIYIGIEQLRLFGEVSLGETFGSVPLVHLSYMSQYRTLRKTTWGKSDELYDLQKTQWEKSKDLNIICCAKFLKTQWENRRRLSA
jgi:hypothetical protein